MKKSNIIKFVLLFIAISIFFSYFISIGYSNEVGIKNGMNVRHIHNLSIYPVETNTSLTFTKVSDELFHVEWEWLDSPFGTGSWDVNTSTRTVTNVTNFGPSDYTSFWIHTDVSLNDQVKIDNIMKGMNTGNATAIFTITGEAMHGSMKVWVLEDAYGSVRWYEKTKGFLVNGTSVYLTDWETFEFVSTNAFSKDEAIPGYSLILIISIIVAVSITIMKKQKIIK